jgi:predicted SAM-dependent methyltransferase
MKLRTKLAYAVLPPHVWSILKWELKLTHCRWLNVTSSVVRQRLKVLRQARHLRLHLGCGKRIISGWVNIDGIEREGTDLQWDLRQKLPFADGSAELIYSEHVIEHLFEEDALRLFYECYRVLEPGGMMRVGVPDAELYLRNYVTGDTAFFKGLERLGGAVVPLSTPMRVVNQMFRMGGHHLFAWDDVTLVSALTSVGFVGIERWGSRESARQAICLDDPSHAFETLYIEVTKPH